MSRRLRHGGPSIPRIHRPVGLLMYEPCGRQLSMCRMQVLGRFMLSSQTQKRSLLAAFASNDQVTMVFSCDTGGTSPFAAHDTL